MENEYYIAVILPCWNCEQYIGEMMECLLKQTLQDWRAIFVDDHSTDGTAEVIHKYQQKDNRILYFERDREPKGAPTCRNIGIKLASKAKYIVFFDPDDLIPPYCLEQRVEYLERHPNIDIASFPTKAFYTTIDDNTRWGFGRKCFPNTLECLLNWRTLQLCGVSSIYRREKVENCGLVWDEKIRSMQDSDFNISSLLLGMSQEFAPNAKYDYFYRQVRGSISKNIKSEEHIKSHIYLITKNIHRLKDLPNFDFILRAYIVTMIELFTEHPQYIAELCKELWIKRHFVFWLKLKIVQTTKLRGKKYLFKKEIDYNKKRIEAWSQFIADDIAKNFQ